MWFVQHDWLWTDPSSLRVPQHLSELVDDYKILHKNAQVSTVTVMTVVAVSAVWCLSDTARGLCTAASMRWSTFAICLSVCLSVCLFVPLFHHGLWRVCCWVPCSLVFIVCAIYDNNYNYYYSTLHTFNGLFSRTTWVSRYQNGKTSLDLNGARDDGVLGCGGISWTICKQSAPRSRQITAALWLGEWYDGTSTRTGPLQWKKIKNIIER